MHLQKRCFPTPSKHDRSRFDIHGLNAARGLTRQLRELEDCGIVNRYVHAQIPPKVDYSLTALGKKLTPILHAMHDWGEEARKSRARPKR